MTQPASKKNRKYSGTTIDHDAFVEWATSNFDNVIVSGSEVKLDDIWWYDEFGIRDSKNHCSINTEKACFNTFKSKRGGHLLEFVMEVEKCSWEDAASLLGADNSLSMLEKRLDKFFEVEAEMDFVPTAAVGGKLPPMTYLLSSLSEDNPVRRRAAEYLSGRKLAIDGLMICLSGKYANRLVIPYYGPDSQLIYFNTREINDKPSKLRYLGPEKDEFGAGKSDVLWMKTWPPTGSKLYLTEGEFDAMTLCKCGFKAGACGGKTLDPKQIELLRHYRVVIAFDNDKAGKDGFLVANELLANGFDFVRYVRPPNGFKDWNKFLVEHSELIVKTYIDQQEKEFGPDALNTLLFKEKFKL